MLLRWLLFVSSTLSPPSFAVPSRLAQGPASLAPCELPVPGPLSDQLRGGRRLADGRESSPCAVGQAWTAATLCTAFHSGQARWRRPVGDSARLTKGGKPSCTSSFSRTRGAVGRPRALNRTRSAEQRRGRRRRWRPGPGLAQGRSQRSSAVHGAREPEWCAGRRRLAIRSSRGTHSPRSRLALAHAPLTQSPHHQQQRPIYLF